MSAFFGRQARCPKCGTKLAKSGTPCEKCDFGHIILTTEPPDVRLREPGEIVPVYITDDIVSKIYSLREDIGRTAREMAILEKIPRRGCYRLMWNKGAYWDSEEAKQNTPIDVPREIIDLLIEELQKKQNTQKQQLEDMRCGRVEEAERQEDGGKNRAIAPPQSGLDAK